MNPQPELTEEVPAQEKVATFREEVPPLPAMQVYAQRFAESPLNGEIPGPVFIP